MGKNNFYFKNIKIFLKIFFINKQTNNNKQKRRSENIQ
jgi:hypothetical protein